MHAASVPSRHIVPGPQHWIRVPNPLAHHLSKGVSNQRGMENDDRISLTGTMCR